MQHQLRRLVLRKLAWAFAALLLTAGGALILLRGTGPARSPGDLLQEGLRAVDEGRPDDAALCIDGLLLLPDGAPAAELIRGAQRLRADDANAALRAFSRIRPEGELRAPLLQLTGEALYRTGQLHYSARVFRELTADSPQAPEPHRWLGAAYYDLGLRSPAIAELEAAARLAPQDQRPHRLLGLIYYDFQQYGDAAPHYRRALELHDPAEQPDIVRELAHCLVELRQYDEALGLLKNAGRDPDLLVRRAEVHWGMGDHGAARRDVEAALSKAPDDPRGNLLLARIELAAGDVGPAIDRLRRARRAAPHELSICYALASALRQAGMDQAAEETFAEVKRLTDLHAHYVKLAEAAAQAPADAGVRQELADICRELGLPAVSAMWDRAARACQMVQGQETDLPPLHGP